MSYAEGTTHYNLPQTVGTDKRDWFDTNQAFADIDAALFGAVQTSTETATALDTLAGRVTTVEGNQATDEVTLAEHGTAIGALQTTVTQHTTAIADVRQDAEDMISAYNEGAAETSTHAYAVGDYFIYNDVLYRATQTINIGDAIVPNTNCEATNVSTEVIQIKSALSDKADVSALTSLGTDWHLLAAAATDGAEVALDGSPNDYKWCAVMYVNDSNAILDNLILPMSFYLSSNSNKPLNVSYAGGNNYHGSVNYLDNTHAKFQLNANTVKLYGIR